jgi:nitroreductase
MFTNEKLLDLIKERRSVRLFNEKQISREDILSIIEAGIWAPTGCNNQELRFLILDKNEEVAEMMEFKPFKGVSAVVLLFYDMSLPMSQKMYVKNNSEKHLPYVDAGLAMENMVLQAKSKGIDSCIFNVSEYHFKIFRKNKRLNEKMIDWVRIKLHFHKSVKENLDFHLRKRLKIPEHLKIICGIALGYAKRYPEVTEIHGNKQVMRKPIDHYIITSNGSINSSRSS